MRNEWELAQLLVPREHEQQLSVRFGHLVNDDEILSAFNVDER